MGKKYDKFIKDMELEDVDDDYNYIPYEIQINYAKMRRPLNTYRNNNWEYAMQETYGR